MHRRGACHAKEEAAPPFPRVVKRGGGSATIYRTTNRGRTLYQVTYWIGGKRERKSFAAFADAHSHAEAQAAAINTGRLAVARMKDSDRDAFVAAESLLRDFHTPVLEAVRSYVAAMKALKGRGNLLDAAREYAERHGEGRTQILVKDAVNALMEAKSQEKLNEGYLAQLKTSLEKFAKAFQVDLSSVKAQEVQKWIRGQGGAPKTQNGRRANLVTLGNYARDFLNALPPGGTEFEKVPKMKQADKEIEVFPTDKMEALLAAARAVDNEEVTLWLVLGGFAGLRPKSEAMRLNWSEVDLERGYIRVKGENKTKTKRLIPMQPNLKLWLKTISKREGKVFSHNADERSQYFARKAGAEIPFDGLRHSFGTFRVAQTADIARVSMEMGNSPEIVRKHYDKVAMAEEGNAWFAIEPPKKADAEEADEVEAPLLTSAEPA